METEIVPEKDLEVVKAETASVVAKANGLALAIIDETSKLEAETFLLDIKVAEHKTEKFFEPIVTAAHQAWKRALEGKNIVLEPILKAQKTIKGALGIYNAEVERQRRVEQERLAAEAKFHAEQLALEAAQHAEAAGDHQAAAAIVEQAAAAPAPAVVAPKQEQTKGIRYQDKWTGEVVDIFSLLRAIEQKLAPMSLIMVNQGELNRLAAATKGSIVMPGVRWKVEKTVAAKTK